MKRRQFLKSAATLSSSRLILPASFSIPFLANKAYAYSPTYTDVNITAPSVMPQVINIHLYGGASELAGNLTNMAQNAVGDSGTSNSIAVNSKNDYADAFGSDILLSTDDGGQITENGFWYDAGGGFMENMLANSQMNVYRTIYKQKEPTRSHRESIFMAHKAALDLENTPGIGTRLALMIAQNPSAYSGSTFADGSAMATTSDALSELILPFVSFEGASVSYTLDVDNTLDLNLRGLTMDSNFNNPYSRGNIGSSETAIETMVSERYKVINSQKSKYSGAWEAFEKRAEMATRMTSLSAVLDDSNLPTRPSGYDITADTALHSEYGHTLVDTADSDRLQYPGTTFAERLRAAVTLMLYSPQTMYATVSTAGIGGWDDHNNATSALNQPGYRRRMRQLMQAIDVAMKHIEWSGENGITTINGTTRTNTSNIIINIMGDFGRIVSLNDSGGWDHGNNQNLFTFGGSGISGRRSLGNIIGETVRTGTSGTNNQYTVPDSGSKTWEPMSVAASTYSYFGATNPYLMTADPTYNPEGDKTLEDES